MGQVEPHLQPLVAPTKGKGLCGVSIGGDSLAVWLDPSEEGDFLGLHPPGAWRAPQGSWRRL